MAKLNTGNYDYSNSFTFLDKFLYYIYDRHKNESELNSYFSYIIYPPPFISQQKHNSVYMHYK